MDLQKLFVALEQAGVTTIGQARSALVSLGIQPASLALNHSDLPKALSTLKPVTAKPGTAAAATAVPAPASPKPSDVAVSQAAELAVKIVAPQLEHLLEVAINQIHSSIAQHMDPVHATLTQVQTTLAAAAAKASAPAAAPAQT